MAVCMFFSKNLNFFGAMCLPIGSSFYSKTDTNQIINWLQPNSEKNITEYFTITGNNTEKNMGALVFGKAKNNCSWSLGGAVSQPGYPGWCLDEDVGVKPTNSFFFHIKHAKTMIVRVNRG